jgi:3-hydroxyacyl-[acyl-carrier-protein] dehydratase
MTTDAASGALDITGILEYLPHRYPFLLIDRVLWCTPGKALRGQKNVTMNEPFFAGHFPGHPVMPGVLVVEGMAQAACILAARTLNTKLADGMLFFFAGIDNARFRRQVIPGDVLTFDVEVLRIARGLGKFACRASVGSEIAAEGELMAALRAGKSAAGTPTAARG